MAYEYIRVKDWMYVDRQQRMNPKFVAGVAAFIEFAREHHKVVLGKILCPCDRCGNKLYQNIGEVELHIVKHGFTRFYTTWLYHGEEEDNAAEEEKDNFFPGEEEEDNSFRVDFATPAVGDGISTSKAQAVPPFAVGGGVSISGAQTVPTPAVGEGASFGTQATPARSVHSEHSAVGGGAFTSGTPAVQHPRNYRATRAAARAQACGDVAGGHSRPVRGTRGPNQSYKLRPDPAKGQGAFPIIFTADGRYTGANAERFGRYIGDESRHLKKYPLHIDWGVQHNRSFDAFWDQAQMDYAFLAVDPDDPDEEDRVIDLRAIYRGLKNNMQTKVRYNRNKLKVDCYGLWLATPEEEREALLRSPAFSEVDLETWPLMCLYWASARKQKQAEQNKENRKSQKRGRATYTGGSKNITRATEAARARRQAQGGTSSVLQDYLSVHATSTDPATSTLRYPDTTTEEYCANISEVDFSGETDPVMLIPILDAVHGGHHGDYERGRGLGPNRAHLRLSSTPAVIPATPRQRRLEEELATLKSAVEELKEMLLQRATPSAAAPAPHATPPGSPAPATPAPATATPAPALTIASFSEHSRLLGFNEDQMRQLCQILGVRAPGPSQ